MKSYKTALATAVSSILLAASFQANAAISITTPVVLSGVDTAAGNIKEFDVQTKSWASPDMGMKGWAHTSKWGFFFAQKGKTVTIVADDAAAIDNALTTPTVETSLTHMVGFHPAISVWHRKLPTNAATTQAKADGIMGTTPYNYVSGSGMNYNQSTDMNEAASGTVKAVAMQFVTSGYDADGMGYYFHSVDAVADSPILLGQSATTGHVNYGPFFSNAFLAVPDIAKASILKDSTAGKVTVSFVAPTTGIYQFVVGGVQPDAGSAADTATNSMMSGTLVPVGVSVKVQ